MAVRIIAIRKDNGNHQNPHEAISHYKWLNERDNDSGIIDRPSMVRWMEDKKGKAYVRDTGSIAYCYVNRSAYGTKFLQTYADSKWSNNLLSLPEC